MKDLGRGIRKFRIFFIVVVVTLLFAVLTKAASIASFNLDVSMQNDSSMRLEELMRSNAVLLRVMTNTETDCKYSLNKGASFANMEGSFDLNFGLLHEKTFTGLTDGFYKYYVRCKIGGNESKELEAKFSVSVPVSAEITIGDGEFLKEGKAEIKVKTSKIVSQTPSLSYSFDGTSYNPIPLSGSGSSWTGYLIIEDNVGEKVGSFRFQGRDLEGNVGSEITKGSVFIVDTKKPATVSDINAIGYSGKIELNWHYDEKEVDEFKVYRSTEQGVGFSNYYKTFSGKSFSDNSVERSKTYYYRVAAVDKAGNEADLSPEVFATVLIENTTQKTSTGLDLRYYGLVESFLTEVDLAVEGADNTRDNFEAKSGKEAQLFSDLKLSREIEGAKTELGSLRREAENYKLQNLDKVDLDKKLNSAQLKLATIKKKIPESLIVDDEKTNSQEIQENDVSQIILELGVKEELQGETLKKSLSVMSDRKFKAKTSAYNLQIVYSDGSRKKISFVKEEIEFEGDENSSIVEYIPKEIAESASDLNFKNVDYDVLKEDPIVKFKQEVRVISYSIDGQINLDNIKKIKTIALYNVEERVSGGNSVSGYFSFVSLDSVKSYSGFILGIVLVFVLFLYFIFTKRKIGASDALLSVRNLIENANSKIVSGEFSDAKNIYNQLTKEYKNLSKKEKIFIYKELNEIYKKIGG